MLINISTVYKRQSHHLTKLPRNVINIFFLCFSLFLHPWPLWVSTETLKALTVMLWLKSWLEQQCSLTRYFYSSFWCHSFKNEYSLNFCKLSECSLDIFFYQSSLSSLIDVSVLQGEALVEIHTTIPIILLSKHHVLIAQASKLI